jgi:transposase-like protein
VGRKGVNGEMTVKKYTQQFKDDVLAFWANNPDMSVRKICQDFGIANPTFYEWRKQAGLGGRSNGSNLCQAVSYEEHHCLQKRNRELEQENLILRRAAAYFAKDVLPKGNTLSS